MSESLKIDGVIMCVDRSEVWRKGVNICVGMNKGII